MHGDLGASDTAIRRRLTEIEYVNWCFGQPYNIAVVVHLADVVTVEEVRAAVAGLQRRHPLLGVTTVVDQDRTPWLESAGVGPVPVRVVELSGPEDAALLLDVEVMTPFVMDHAPLRPDGTEAPRPPLLRVTVLDPPESRGGIDIVLCAQHVIADGLSMYFLVRDLVRLLREPGIPPGTADAAARCEHVLPPEAARRMHRTPAAALTVRALLRAYRVLRSVPPRHPVAGHDCRNLPVGPAFLPLYTAVNTPVSLRSQLRIDVGESVGLYVGNAVVMRSYRARRDFWWNARAFYHRLRRAMRDLFLMIRLCSPAVPRPVVHDVMTELMALVGRRRPLAVTNLGVLDGTGLTLSTGDGPRVESFHAGMSGFASASVLTAYTIDGALHLHLRGRPDMTSEQTISEAERATALLLAAL